jgi:hypothetical protein
MIKLKHDIFTSKVLAKNAAEASEQIDDSSGACELINRNNIE